MYNYDLQSIVKIVGISLPLIGNRIKNSRSIDIKYTDDQEIAIIYDFIDQNNNVQFLTTNYYKSKGSTNDKMNPTIRSKIIFGVAATMKQLHQVHSIFHLKISNVYLNDKLEPIILNTRFQDIIEDYYHNELCQSYTIQVPNELAPEVSYDGQYLYSLSSEVYSFAMFLYLMFEIKENLPKYKSYLDYQREISRGKRLKRPSTIPDNYWNLIQICWSQEPEKRPTFDQIVSILKDDRYALEEFGMKTDLKQLHEYQNRIEMTLQNDCIKSIVDLKVKVMDLQSQLNGLNSLLSNPKEKSDKSNFYIDEEEEEKYHDVIEKVGEGAAATTYKVVDTRTGSFICKKILKETNDDHNAFKNVQNIIKEFEILHLLEHPSICKAIGINISEIIKDGNIKKSKKDNEKTTIAIFLEFIENKLSDILKSDIINNTLKVRIVVEIAHAMNYLHKNGIIHRDLKIENIMLNSVFEVKIVDFGLIRIHEIFNDEYSFLNESMSYNVGTLAYMSPEMLNEQEYDYKTDVYSFGVVLFFIFYGKLPKQSLKDKTNGKEIVFPSESNNISQFCIDLIKKCLAFNPSKRPTFKEILTDIRKHNYELASHIDQSVLYMRDHQLELFKKT